MILIRVKKARQTECVIRLAAFSHTELTVHHKYEIAVPPTNRART
jgi:hypothetical protein